MANPNHHICIHGHFYQPPRENPWLGVIEPQPGAAPFHDWNERITAECYAAGARARIHNERRQIDRLANNFLNISFNIGPTLLHWLHKRHPHTTRRILAADRKSAERLEGHGNAIAQAYNHMILPLANARDRHTQIVWGLADFEHFYQRRAEGMWLPECAVDRKTVRALIDHGVRFIILAPTQAARVRHFHSSEWIDARQHPLETRCAYRIFDRDGRGGKLYHRWLDVFFYDGAISNAIAFQHLLRDANKMERLFREAFDANASIPQLVSVATDGESYGHHEPYGEMCLAYFFEALVKERGQAVDNYAHFLSRNPPAWEAELWEGERGEGSSWSCSHGVDRWKRACGCTSGGKDWYKQEWRAPLRESFDALRSRIDEIFAREGAILFLDPWNARDDYIRVLLDPTPETRRRFLETHAPEAAEDDSAAARAWQLLGMEHQAMLMYTSCAWFFADIGGVEPVQNMRYALRAVEHASAFTDENLESKLVDGLERARANEPSDGTGGNIFRTRVRPSFFSRDNIAACYVMLEMYELPHPGYHYRVAFDRTDRSPAGWLKTFRGRLMLEDEQVFQRTAYAFLAAHISDREASCVVRACDSEAEAEAFLAEWGALSPQELAVRLRAEGFLIRDMPQEERQRLLDHVLASRLAAVNLTFSDNYDNVKPLLTILAENDIEPPEVLRVAAEFVLTRRFREICENIARKGRWDPTEAQLAKALLEEAGLYHLKANRTPAAPVIAGLILRYFDRLIEAPEISAIEEVCELMRFSQDVGFFFENGGKIENRYWRLLRSRIVPMVHRLRRSELAPGSAEARAAEELIARVYRLGITLNFSEAHLDRLLAYAEHAEPDEGEM